MNDLISRSDLMAQVVRKKSEIGAIRYTEGFNDAILRVRSMIHSAKAIDAAPVVHARWIPIMLYGKEHAIKCSVCNNCDNPSKVPGQYCWQCGARMDGESE